MLRSLVRTMVRVAPTLDLWPVVPMVTSRRRPRATTSAGASRTAHRSELGTDRLGRLAAWDNIHLVDASVFPTVPATTFTLTIMANAHRIASEVVARPDPSGAAEPVTPAPGGGRGERWPGLGEQELRHRHRHRPTPPPSVRGTRARSRLPGSGPRSRSGWSARPGPPRGSGAPCESRSVHPSGIAARSPSRSTASGRRRVPGRPGGPRDLDGGDGHPGDGEGVRHPRRVTPFSPMSSTRDRRVGLIGWVPQLPPVHRTPATDRVLAQPRWSKTCELRHHSPPSTAATASAARSSDLRRVSRSARKVSSLARRTKWRGTRLRRSRSPSPSTDAGGRPRSRCRNEGGRR